MLAELEAEQASEKKEILSLAAIYHDAIYDPRATDNEEQSAALLLPHAADSTDRVITEAAHLIVASKWAAPPWTDLAKRFFELDSWQLTDGCSLQERAKYERAIFREYQWTPWATYREKRRDFLRGWAERFPQHQRGVRECVELLGAFEPRVAVYPGSFHPFHRGHLSILRQAEAIFDKVIIAIGVNRQKPGADESTTGRLAEVAARLRFHEVASFDGLLTRFVDQLGVPATIVRGVRDGTDLEAELRFSRFLNELRPGTRMVWISCGAELQHLSSSAIRELEAIEPGSGERYVPDLKEIYELCGGTG